MKPQGWLGRLAATVMGPGWQDANDPEGLAFDADHGTETATFDWGNYEPTFPRVANRVLDLVEAHLGDAVPSASFVDLGCGKGRVLMLARRRRFARVIGVEMSEALVASCRKNLLIAGHSDVEVVWGDAAAVPLPGPPLVLYLYNPFGAEVLLPILRRNPAAVLAYVEPRQSALVERLGWRCAARSRREQDGSEDDLPWRLYVPGPDLAIPPERR